MSLRERIGAWGRARRVRRTASSGQAMVEFAIIVPLFMILLLGVLEFGFIFANHQGLEYATREGARTGSALSNGAMSQAGSGGCASIDPQVIAAVQRVLTGKGSMVQLANVSQIRIWKSDAAGNPVSGSINVWANTGLNSGPTVDGAKLSFTATSSPWNACTRDASGDPSANPPTIDIIGVDLTYAYHMATPLGALLHWAGANVLTMNDETIMVLNP